LTAQLSAVDEAMEHWRRELEQAKAQQEMLDKRIEKETKRSAQMASQLAELDKARTSLRKRVIPEPEKELRTIEDLKARQLKEEELLAGAQKLRADRTTRRDHLEKSRKAVLKAVTLSQDISETLDHVNAERRTIKDYKTSIATDENILRELDVNAGRIQTQLDSLKDRTSIAQAEQDKLKEEKLKQMDAARSRKMTAERDHAEILAQIKELDLEVAKLETEETALVRGHTERTHLTKSNILGLISQLRAYQQGIHTAMRDTMQAQQDALLKQQQQQLDLSN
jgi:chromosome segregation ATPase